LTQWPSSSGYSYRLIRNISGEIDFIELSKGGEMMGFIPLPSARVAMVFRRRISMPLTSVNQGTFFRACGLSWKRVSGINKFMAIRFLRSKGGR